MVKAVVSKTKLEGRAAVLRCVFLDCFPDLKLHLTHEANIYSFAVLNIVSIPRARCVCAVLDPKSVVCAPTR